MAKKEPAEGLRDILKVLGDFSDSSLENTVLVAQALVILCAELRIPLKVVLSSVIAESYKSLPESETNKMALVAPREEWLDDETTH